MKVVLSMQVVKLHKRVDCICRHETLVLPLDMSFEKNHTTSVVRYR